MTRRMEAMVRALVVVALASGCPLRPASAQNDDAFLQFVRDIGFGNPGSNTDTKYILKWAKPVTVELSFSARTPTKVVTSVANAFDEAQQASGLPVQYFREKFNTMILAADWKAGGLEKSADTIAQFFKTKADASEFISFNRRTGKSCASRIAFDEANNIAQGLILIDVGDADVARVMHCSARTVAGLFGLGALSIADDKPYPSVANNALATANLTEYDKRFLHLLYSPSIRSGMTEAQGMPIIRSLVQGR